VNETRALINLVIGTVAAQPPAVKRWLLNHPRFLLGLLFRLERGDIVISPAGPPGLRFRMKLSWQGHTPYALGAYEQEVIDVLRRDLHPGDTCLDVGGHLGYYSLLMSRIVGPAGRVITFEPIRENLEVLEENLKLNQVSNVAVLNTALGENSGHISLIRPKAEPLSWTPSIRAYAVEGQQSTDTVCVNKLDVFLEREGFRPSLIKIDVEGAELNVLRGAMETLRAIRPIIFVEIHGWGDATSQEVLDLFSALQYSVSIIGTRGNEAFCRAVPQSKLIPPA
jgi:FkbM family methyltransferase